MGEIKGLACTQQKRDSAISGLQSRVCVLTASPLLLRIEQKPKGLGWEGKGHQGWGKTEIFSKGEIVRL